MFDDLRSSDQPMFEGEQLEKPQPDLSGPGYRPLTRKKKSRKILGMTAIQRFILVTLAFLMVCVLGATLLFVLEKIVLPL